MVAAKVKGVGARRHGSPVRDSLPRRLERWSLLVYSTGSRNARVLVLWAWKVQQGLRIHGQEGTVQLSGSLLSGDGGG